MCISIPQEKNSFDNHKCVCNNCVFWLYDFISANFFHWHCFTIWASANGNNESFSVSLIQYLIVLPALNIGMHTIHLSTIINTKNKCSTPSLKYPSCVTNCDKQQKYKVL